MPDALNLRAVDAHYGDRIKMAMAFAGLLNKEARALEADGVDVIQFDEPAFNVFMAEVADWGIEALHRAMGFVPVGVYGNIGYKCGAWHDVAWLQLALREDRGEPVDPPCRTAELITRPGWQEALQAGSSRLR